MVKDGVCEAIKVRRNGAGVEISQIIELVHGVIPMKRGRKTHGHC